MIDGTLFVKLFELFPAAFSCARRHVKKTTVNTPFWTDEIETGEEEQVLLSECILNTAQGIKNKYGEERAFEFLEGFADKGLQQRQIQAFLG